jgi:hypothetical protein
MLPLRYVTIKRLNEFDLSPLLCSKKLEKTLSDIIDILLFCCVVLSGLKFNKFRADLVLESFMKTVKVVAIAGVVPNFVSSQSN